MGVSTIKPKLYAEMWNNEKFKITKLKCQPHELIALELLLSNSYNKNGFSIIDKYSEKNDISCKVEYLLLAQDEEKIDSLTDPQAITDKVLNDFRLLNI